MEFRAEPDPWPVTLSFLAKIDSYKIPEVVGRTGLTVNWSLTERESFSAKYRRDVYRSRIDAAYAALPSAGDRRRVADILAEELKKEISKPQELDEALRKIGQEPSERFFPSGTQHDAYVRIREILQGASQSPDVVDPYVDNSTLTLLAACPKQGIHFRVLTFRHPSDFALEADKWRKQHGQDRLEIRTIRKFHDRFIVVDGRQCWHHGASIKDAGNRGFMLSQIEDTANRSALVQQISKAWDDGTELQGA